VLLVVLSALLAAGSARPHNQEPQRDPHPPLSLEQALDRLEKTLPPKTLQEMRRGTERDMITYHFSVGLWMRKKGEGKPEGKADAKVEAKPATKPAKAAPKAAAARKPAKPSRR